MNHESDDDSRYMLRCMCAAPVCSLDRPFHYVVARSLVRSIHAIRSHFTA